MFKRVDTSSTMQGEHALVVGGSMAGLLAARVLANYFERVTIVERDLFPREPLPRKGVPQAHHVHALLKRGRITLERLFPGLQHNLLDADAPVLDMAFDFAWLTPAGWGVRFSSDLDFVSVSRDLLDWSLRRRLAGFENVHFLQERLVAGLLPDADGSGVAGVRLHPQNQLKGKGLNDEEQLLADLVVDATGRGSRMPQWLEALGYDRPHESIVNAHLGYASRIYRRPPGFRGHWKGMFIQTAPPEFTRGGLLLPVEGDRWLVTLTGGDKDYPPIDEAGFMDFARSLRSSLLYNAIKDAEALTSIHGYRATENRLRRYDQLSHWPEKLIVIGDAACAFNPVYAQGMTTAALGAETLDRCLSEQHRSRPQGDLSGLGQCFQKKLAKLTKVPWTFATAQDYRYRGTEGGTPDRITCFRHRYVDQVLQLSTKDAKVRLAFLEVMNMLKLPTALFQPSVLVRVLRHAATGGLSDDGEVKTRSRLPKAA